MHLDVQIKICENLIVLASKCNFDKNQIEYIPKVIGWYVISKTITKKKRKSWAINEK